MSRCSEVWRSIQQAGITKGFSGVKEEVIFDNPGKMEVVLFRGRYYGIDKEGKLSLLDNKHEEELRKQKLSKFK